MKFFTVFFLCFCILFSFPVSAAEKTVSSEYFEGIYDEMPEETAVFAAVQNLDISAKSVVLMEPETLTVLYESKSDLSVAPASITKIMSLLLIMEAIESGGIGLDTVVTASHHACSMGGSQIWLKENEQMTVDELLRATVIASANDATVALAETVAGSEEGFVALMNEKAEALGMNNTHFVNCTGLDADGHMTTAYDVAVMSSHLLRHELIKKYSTVWMDSLRNGKSELVNTNKLVRFYSGCTGLKTGTTGKAGHCVSASAEKNGLKLVAVVMGADSSANRFVGARKLLDYGFANFAFTKLDFVADDILVPVKNGKEDSVGLVAEGSLPFLCDKKSISGIVRQTEIPETISAPVKRGDKIGEVIFKSADGEIIGSIPLLAEKDCEKLTFLTVFKRLIAELFRL